MSAVKNFPKIGCLLKELYGEKVTILKFHGKKSNHEYGLVWPRLGLIFM